MGDPFSLFCAGVTVASIVADGNIDATIRAAVAG